jgi:hypothetical protein
MTTWFEPSVWAGLRMLLAAVKNSPIVPLNLVRLPVPLADWMSVRKSGNADAFVLAWLASEGRRGRGSRTFM